MTAANERFSSELASHAHHEAHGEDHHGPGAKLVIVGYGFWIFLLSDIVMFSAFFAAHAVLQDSTGGGDEVAHSSERPFQRSPVLSRSASRSRILT